MEAKERYEIIRRSSPVLKYCECFDEGSEKWNLETHSHPCIELVYYIEGKAGLEVGGFHVNASIFDTVVYPHEHFCEKITLDELAELEHISVSYLSRKFRKYTDMTIVAYINRLRVEAAKQMLASSGCSTSEIAWKIGYESPKYFHRVFKSYTGESPSAFRKAYQAGRERPISDAPTSEAGS